MELNRLNLNNKLVWGCNLDQDCGCEITLTLSPDTIQNSIQRNKGLIHQEMSPSSDELRSDLENDSNHNSSHVQSEERVTQSDGSIIFMLSETLTGKIKTSLLHEEHHRFQNKKIQNETYEESFIPQIEGSAENSVENQQLIHNLINLHQISPERDEDENRPNVDIEIGPFSENKKSNLDDSQTINPSSKDHILVESNQDIEDDEFEANNRMRSSSNFSNELSNSDIDSKQQSPCLNLHKNDCVFHKGPSFWNNEDTCQSDEESKVPIISSNEEKLNDKDYLDIGKLSPVTKSCQTISSNSGLYMSPQASTFGINTDISWNTKTLSNSHPKDSSHTLNNKENMPIMPINISPQRLDTIHNTEIRKHGMSPIWGHCFQYQTCKILHDETNIVSNRGSNQNLLWNKTWSDNSNRTSVKLPEILHNMPIHAAGVAEIQISQQSIDHKEPTEADNEMSLKHNNKFKVQISNNCQPAEIDSSDKENYPINLSEILCPRKEPNKQKEKKSMNKNTSRNNTQVINDFDSDLLSGQSQYVPHNDSYLIN